MLLFPFISGCYVYIDGSVHDRSFDSEFEEDGIITAFGASYELNENVEGYIQHQSMPFYTETVGKRITDKYNVDKGLDKGGNGVNQIGLKLKYKLF